VKTEKRSKPVIRYKKEVNTYLNNLIDILFENNYFSFVESALVYITEMKEFVEKYIDVLPKFDAPHYFSQYQVGMKYIVYKSNHVTTWYIFFLQEENRYLICYITNNHFEGQFIR